MWRCGACQPHGRSPKFDTENLNKDPFASRSPVILEFYNARQPPDKNGAAQKSVASKSSHCRRIIATAPRTRPIRIRGELARSLSIIQAARIILFIQRSLNLNLRPSPKTSNNPKPIPSVGHGLALLWSRLHVPLLKLVGQTLHHPNTQGSIFLAMVLARFLSLTVCVALRFGAYERPKL